MAKQSLNIPMYANAWCGESPCDSEYMDIFHVGCPSLDGMGPDSSGDVLWKWVRPWNMLVEPEFSWGENYFRALSLGALLSGQYWNGEVDLVRAPALYDLVRAMEPVLITKRNPGDLLGFTTVPASGGHEGGGKFPRAGHTWEQNYQDMKVTFTLTGDTVNYVAKPHTAGPTLGPNGLIIHMAPDEYIITSTKIDVELRRADGGNIGVAWAEEGHFQNGRWMKEKGASTEAHGDSIKLSFPRENLKYGQIRLKITHPDSPQRTNVLPKK